MTRAVLFLLALTAGASLGLSLLTLHVSVELGRSVAALDHVVFGTEPTP